MIRDWQAGDLAAFERLFHQHKDMVFRVAYSVLGDSRESEDAVQEVFIRVYRFPDKFEGGEQEFGGWLRRVTLNFCINRARRNGFRRWRSLEELSEWGKDRTQDDKSISPARALEEDEKQEQARNFLSRLSDRHYEVMVLRYYHELSYEEIARMLDIPLGTVRSRLSNAVKALRQSRESGGQGGWDGEA
ncbi:MAG: RNA polymerase sigma factor [Dehalococcoidia bacterium]